MARLLRNFRYRSLQEPIDPENLRYEALLESILALDDEFYKFPDSNVPSLQTLCIKWVVRRSSVLFETYAACSDEQLLRALPPGPFDGLPPLLCDLFCDLLLGLREPDSSTIPLYCVISPYTRCLCLREPLTEVAADALIALLAARARHLAELTWTGAPMTQRLHDYLTCLPSLTAFITEEPLDPVRVRELLRRCPALRALQLRNSDCVTSLADREVVGPELRDLRLLEDEDVSVDLAAVCAVFPGLEKLSVQPTRPTGKWCIEEMDLSFSESEPWFADLKELSLKGCDNCTVLQRPLKALTKLMLERCKYFMEDLAIHPRLNFVSLVHCDTFLRSRSPDDPLPAVNAETLHLDIVDELINTSMMASALIFPRVRRLALCGDVRAVSPEAEFKELCELHYSFVSSVLAERVLASLPLAQLQKLSFNYQTDDGTPLALETLSRCSRLTELELEGFSDLSVPRGLQLPAVRRLRLRGGACRPSVVQWLMGALPGLQCLQLVELTIRSDLWAPWFREWRQAGIEVELEGGCSIPLWRRSSIRSHAPSL